VVGQVGELVITEPMPSMPLFLWNDRTAAATGRASSAGRASGDTRLDQDHRARQRDHAGRSDSTIHRGGIRMGTSDLPRRAAVNDVVDALVVASPPGTGAHALFVVLRESAS
jgi:acetoacetyl-CoA synthetase